MAVSIPMQSEIERHICARTGRRIRNLSIDFGAERIVLHGLAPSYYVKQLAQSGVRDLLPDVRLENTIIVDRETEFFALARGA